MEEETAGMREKQCPYAAAHDAHKWSFYANEGDDGERVRCPGLRVLQTEEVSRPTDPPPLIHYTGGRFELTVAITDLRQPVEPMTNQMAAFFERRQPVFDLHSRLANMTQVSVLLHALSEALLEDE